LKGKKGQFILIAALLIAIMMVSVALIMYSARTYYRHERWEEYLSIIDDVKLASTRLVEISLANYTWTMNNGVLRDNLDRWQRDLRKAYPGYGVSLGYLLSNSPQQAYGLTITYIQGLASQWSNSTSYSSANVTISLNLTSFGLTGYRFMAHVFLQVTILPIWKDKKLGEWIIPFTVNKEGNKEGLVPVSRLSKAEALVDDAIPITDYTYRYNETVGFVYEMRYSGSKKPSSVQLTVVDSRVIRVNANATL